MSYFLALGVVVMFGVDFKWRGSTLDVSMEGCLSGIRKAFTALTVEMALVVIVGNVSSLDDWSAFFSASSP